MNIDEEKGIAGTDMIIAIIAIIVFSTLIFSLIYNNSFENIKLNQENLAMLYLIQIFENIGIEDYDNIEVGEYLDIGKYNYPEKIENLVPEEAKKNFKIDILVNDPFNENNDYDYIIKKIVAKISYAIADKEYNLEMERIKIKE